MRCAVVSRELAVSSINPVARRPYLSSGLVDRVVAAQHAALLACALSPRGPVETQLVEDLRALPGVIEEVADDLNWTLSLGLDGQPLEAELLEVVSITQSTARQLGQLTPVIEA